MIVKEHYTFFLKLAWR